MYKKSVKKDQKTNISYIGKYSKPNNQQLKKKPKKISKHTIRNAFIFLFSVYKTSKK